MFGRLFCFRMKQIIRSKGELFWILFFPIILGSLFYFSFGSLMEGEIDYEPIKTAVVLDKEGEVGSWFSTLVESEEIKDILIPVQMEENAAKRALKNGETEAIIYAQERLEMEVAKEETKTTVLKVFLDTCLHNMDMAREGIDITRLTTDFIQEDTLIGQKVPSVAQYFFALIAMACLYGCFTGLSSSTAIMPNTSAVGARRSVAPVPRLISITADFLATITVQIAALAILLVYLTTVLRVDLGCDFIYALQICIAGSMIGVASGFFIGGLKIKEGIKNGISMGGTMLLCFFSGLMISSMKGMVEKVCPWFNRINPAALITDGFYAFNIGNMQRYYTDLGILAVMAIGLLVICFIRGRREKFASI